MKIATIVLILIVLFTPETVKNLRHLKKNGDPKYPNMRWLPVEEIRNLINTP